MTNPLRLGAGGSLLAVARARAVAARLGAELVPVEAGAASDDAVSALRDALRAEEVDAIVHACPAVPPASVEGVVSAAVPKRGDARDAYCAPAGGFDAAPAGARVGAGTALRAAQLRHRRPELAVVPLEGALETHLGMLDAADAAHLDGMLASAADLARLEHTGAVVEPLGLSDWPTAPGQGALVIETRAGEAKRVAKLDHRPSRLTTDAERGVLARLTAVDASLGATLAATALLDDGLLFLSARLYAPDGGRPLTSSHALYPEDARDPAGELAARVAEELLAEAGGGSGRAEGTP
ncbi:MAG TPA: hydroxymethylbilane synthase [Protaetiibacter sp.]|nr:hydroxymethylbilane synthase [Protaetiibacter sp.]